MKKPVAASSPGQSTRRGSSHVRLPDSSSDEDSDPDDSNVFSPVVKDSEVTAKVCEQRQPTRRERWAYYMDYTTFGRWWQVLDAALNVAYVVLFIHMTTYIIAPSRDPTARPGAPPDTLFMADMILAIIILAQYVPRVYLSLEPGAAAISGMSLASYLATLPVIYAYFQHDDANTDYLDASQFLAFLYPLRFWRMHLSVMSIFAPSKTVGFNFSPITQKAVKLGLSIFNTLITVTAWVHICLYIVQNYYDLSFFDVFYTIAVSSTSGLSTQIIPDNTFSRIVIMYVMIVGAIFIPTNLAELLALVRNKSPYDKSYKGSLYRSHVLIVGNLEYNSLRDFLWEFFCEDHGTATMTTQVVLMAPLEPSEDVESLLADPLYISRVKYVKGSPMSFRSLQKAKAREAKACFVLASTFSDKGAEEDDAETVMTALAIKKFHKKANIFAQVVLPGNKIHFQILADHILCIDEFKHGMLAQNCLAPGFSTLMYLLTTSIPNSIKDTFKERSRNSEWIPEYADGAEMEIYAVNLSSLFAGMSFPKAAERIYMSHGALVFAIGFKVANSEPTIVMNPQNYVICGGETAYIITTQSAVADTIASEGV
ncbi:calcium-activated BK potassium channel alpha subunit-domain-containing protein, partial [Phlyctochytrium arcticum]